MIISQLCQIFILYIDYNIDYLAFERIKIVDSVGGRTFGKSRSGGSAKDMSTIDYNISELFATVNGDKDFTHSCPTALQSGLR